MLSLSRALVDVSSQVVICCQVVEHLLMSVVGLDLIVVCSEQVVICCQVVEHLLM